MARRAWAEAKRKLLPKGTSLRSLVGKDPKRLDASQLEITPIEKFGTMGLTDHKVDISAWRLQVGGKVDRPLSLTYEQVTGLPGVERKELLICPGIFAYQARYQGVLLSVLLTRAGLQKSATEVFIYGPKGGSAKEEKFSLEEIRAERVFLAWSVNGQTLPMKHGYPLRVVAPDHYGDDWVKYVARIDVR